MFALKYLSNVNRITTKYTQFLSIYKCNLKFSHVNHQIFYNNSFRANSTEFINEITTLNDRTKNYESYLNLDTKLKQQQRISKNDIQLLIKSIENEDLNEDSYLLLLECCGNLIPDELPTTRISLAQQAWTTLLNKNVNLTVEYYNALLQCHVDNRVAVPHADFLAKMKCEPNEQTYDLLLECACEDGDIKQALEIINIMKEKGLSANEPVFSSLILCHLRCGDLRSAQNVLDTMRIAQIAPNSNTYTCLMRGYIETNELSHFKTFLHSATTDEFNLKQIISIIHSICISENVELLPLVKRKWSNKVDSRIFDSKLTNVCTHLVYLNKPLIAYELFKCFIEPDVGFVSESDTYCAVLLFEMIRAEIEPEIIIKITDDLQQTNRNTYALFKATELALQVPNVTLSFILFDAMHRRNIPLRNHYFWPLLVHEARLNGEQGIFKIFNKMLDFNIKIESDTLELYSLQYIKNMDADVLIDRLKSFHLTVAESLSPVCLVLLFMGKIRDVADLTSKYKVKLNGNKIIRSLALSFINTNDVKNTVTILKNVSLKDQTDDFPGLLISLIVTRSGANINNEQLITLLQEYKRNNIKISNTSMEKIDYLSRRIRNRDLKTKFQKLLHSIEMITINSNREDLNSHIPHPRNMNLDELENHLIELREKNMETRGILRKLIQMHCRLGNASRVTQLCDEFEKAGYDMSAGIKSSLLDLYLKCDKIEEALLHYNEIKEKYPTFTVDEFKIIDLARLMQINGKYDEAIKLIRSESTNRKILGGDKIERNCWNLLDTIAKTGKTKETKSMFTTLIDGGFCTPTNILLGPLVRVHLNNNDENSAVEEYINCCVKYKKSPLKHELLCYLIKKESTGDLEKIVEATSKLHGIAQTETSLVAALAETGMTKTLRKLFSELTSTLSQKLLDNYCERWLKENKIDALQAIITCSKGLTNIDLSMVYYCLMRHYSSINEINQVLSLWNEMQERHIFPPEKIKNMIDSLLHTQKENPSVL